MPHAAQSSSPTSTAPRAPLTLSQALAYQPPPPLVRHKRRSLTHASTPRISPALPASSSSSPSEGHLHHHHQQQPAVLNYSSSNTQSTRASLPPSVASSSYAPAHALARAPDPPAAVVPAAVLATAPSASSPLARRRGRDSFPAAPSSPHLRTRTPPVIEAPVATPQNQTKRASGSATGTELAKSPTANAVTGLFVRPSRSSSLFMQLPSSSPPANNAKLKIDIPPRSTSLPRSRTDKTDSGDALRAETVDPTEVPRVARPKSTFIPMSQPEIIVTGDKITESAPVECRARYLTPSSSRQRFHNQSESELESDLNKEGKSKREPQKNLAERRSPSQDAMLAQNIENADNQVSGGRQMQMVPFVVPVIPLDHMKAQLLASRVQVEEDAVQLAQRSVLRRSASVSKKTKRRSHLADIHETDSGTRTGKDGASGAVQAPTHETRGQSAQDSSYWRTL